MKANELRIGNLVYLENDVWHDYKNLPMLVTGISTDGNKDEMFPNSTGSVTITLLDKSYDFSQMDEFIKPIPITDEWLLRFGFKRKINFEHSVQYFIGKNPITHDWLFDILWIDGYSEPFYKNWYHKIKYVHQFQNLYSALTGEELNYKN